MTKVKTLNSVESILKRELGPTIKEWLRQVKLVPELSNILLIDSDRTCHLPKLFEDVLNRLRLARGGANGFFLSTHPRMEDYASRRAILHPC